MIVGQSPVPNPLAHIVTHRSRLNYRPQMVDFGRVPGFAGIAEPHPVDE